MISNPSFLRTPRKRFSVEEDKKLCVLVEQFGTSDWAQIAARMPHRDARQCRHRFKNYLMEGHQQLPWTEEEDNYIIQQYKVIGARWVFMSKSLVGRTGNDVKNRWHKHLSKNFVHLNNYSINVNNTNIKTATNPENIGKTMGTNSIGNSISGIEFCCQSPKTSPVPFAENGRTDEYTTQIRQSYLQQAVFPKGDNNVKDICRPNEKNNQQISSKTSMFLQFALN